MIKILLAAVMMMGIGSVLAQAEGTITRQDLFLKGEIRTRYENVDTDNNIKNADAFTNRLMIGAGSDQLFGAKWLGAYVEMTGVNALDYNYNSTNNGKILYDKVVDPKQSRLTQSYLDIKPIDGLLIRAGRQMLNLDNQRFVGAVGWRQMPQTFDAFLLSYTGIENLNFAAAYVTQINTIFADPAKVKIDTRSVVLHTSYKVSDAFNLTNYAYMLGSMHNTYGIALTGKPQLLNGLTINYRVEYANQTDPSMKNENDTKDYKANANYYNLQFGVNILGILSGVGYEVLGGIVTADKKTTFKTPLATLHGQNGWADQFLDNGGVYGLKDLSFMLGYKAKSFGLFKVIYHIFETETAVEDTSIEFGKELDAVYKKKVSGVKGLTTVLKYAYYKAGKTNDKNIGNTDTKKLWVMLEYKFFSK